MRERIEREGERKNDRQAVERDTRGVRKKREILIEEERERRRERYRKRLGIEGEIDRKRVGIEREKIERE